MIRAWRRVVLVLLVGSGLIWQSPPVWTQVAGQFDPSKVEQILDLIERQLSITQLHDSDWLEGAAGQVNRQRTDILQCIDDRERNLAVREETIGADLIDRVSIEEGRTPQEAALAQELESLNRAITECKLLLDKASQLLVRLTELEKAFNRTRLNRKEASIVSNLVQGSSDIGPYLGERWSDLVQMMRNFVFTGHGAIILILSVVGGLAGWAIRRIRHPSRPDGTTTKRLSEAGAGFRFLVLNRAPIIIPILLLFGYLWLFQGFDGLGDPLGQILWLLIGYLLILFMIPVVIQRLNGYAKSVLHQELPVRPLDVRLVWVATVLGFWILEVSILGTDSAYASTQLLVHNILTTLLLLSLLELAWFLNKWPTPSRLGVFLRIVSISGLCLSLFLEWAGYHMLSRFLWQGLLLSLLALGGYVLLEHQLRHFFNGVDHGQAPWQLRFRRVLSIDEGEPVPGLIWVRLSSIALLWGVLLLLLLMVWGASDATLTSLFSLARDGFRFGDTRIVPLNVLIGLLLFTALLILARWIKDNLNRRYLIKSRMESGARDALVTIIGYVGFVIAALFGLSVAGVSFGNLALLAGALSLGIGFGLQNIVNNFVSGIILLFERPIRTGDWIVTGSTEGFVKKISVRSTEVQTFNRADVIVPNSELISAPVTNWTLRDRHGRISIPVGVAYGSDTELVKRLLEESALEVPEVVPDQPELPIRVFFLSFGDSALLFQLRCYVHDVWDMLNATSQLHFTIDRKFREHGITIAFPQREIRLLNDSEPLNEAGS